MQERITVSHEVYQGGKFINVPVTYNITIENENATTYSCNVDMEEDKIPIWMTLRKFNIRTVFSSGGSGYPGCLVTEHSNVPTQNIDEAIFVNETSEAIRAREIRKKRRNL